ncbi:MAG: DUF4221 domain-containing protein [Bacteroidales bacterium]|nr:DUF4221 domain-containing protein [Bacteroidales bacterium]
MIGKSIVNNRAGLSGSISFINGNTALIVSIIVFLFGCSTKSTINPTVTIDFEIQKPPSNFVYLQYIDSGAINRILYLDRDNQSILVLDFNKGKLDSKIEIKSQRLVNSFYYHNEDSLFMGNVDYILLQTPDSVINLLDYPLINIVKAVRNQIPVFLLEFMINNFKPLLFAHNRLYVGSSANFPSLINSEQSKKIDKIRGSINDDGNYSFNYLKRETPLFILRFKPELSINNLQNIFPRSYLGVKTFLPNGAKNSYTFNNLGDIVFSFACDHNLCVLHPDGTKDEPTVSSFYIDKIAPVEYAKLKDQRIWKEREITEPFYLGIKYDPYRDKYYRIVRHQQELYKQNGIYNTVFSASFSVMVISNNFEIENEYFIQGGVYLANSFFVCKEGFGLVKQNTKNLIIDVFKQ